MAMGINATTIGLCPNHREQVNLPGGINTQLILKEMKKINNIAEDTVSKTILYCTLSYCSPFHFRRYYNNVTSNSEENNA